MGQPEVIEFLGKHKKNWYCARELEKYGSSTVLMKLRNKGFIDYKIGYDIKKRSIKKYYYKYKEV